MKRIALLALGAACTLSDPPETGTTAGAVDVTWMNAVGVATAGNSLTKTGATGWNAGAASVETIAGNGYVELTTGENTTAKMAGLSVGDAGQHHSDIDYAFYLKASGGLAVYEGGVQRVGNAGTYLAGDVFRVEKKAGVVTYSQNGVLLHTSSTLSGGPLGVDTSLNSPGATIDDVGLVSTDPPPFSWQNPVGVNAIGNELTKTDSQGAWNAGASSVDTLPGNGYAEFAVGESTTAKMVGLGNGDASQHYDDIEYALWLKANGVVGIYEGGILRSTNVSTYVAGDLFRVVVADGVVSYGKAGQPPFYTSALTPGFPLRIDTSLYTPGATIYGARAVTVGPVCDGSRHVAHAGDVALLAGCVEITGTLTVNAAGTAVSLPDLERVGALVVTSAGSLDLPSLEAITGSDATVDFRVGIAATFPALISIDGDTEIRTTTGVPALAIIRGKLTVLESFSAPALTEIRGNIVVDAQVDSVQLPALTSAYSFKAGIKRTYMTSLDLSSLAFLGGGGGTSRGQFVLRNPRNLDAVTLPSLQSTEGTFSIGGGSSPAAPQSITAPLLESVGGSFGISGQDALTSIDFASLAFVGPSFTIVGNAVLPNCYATDLRDQLLAAGWTGDVFISGNDPGGTCP